MPPGVGAIARPPEGQDTTQEAMAMAPHPRPRNLLRGNVVDPKVAKYVIMVAWGR